MTPSFGLGHRQCSPLAPTTDGPTSVGAGNSIDGGRPCARRLDRNREAHEALADQEEDEEAEDEEEAAKRKINGSTTPAWGRRRRTKR